MTSHDHHLIHKPDEEGLGDLSVDRLVTVPNVITTIRLGCIPLFLWLLFAKDSPGWAGFVLGLIGSFAYVAISGIERAALRWHSSSTGTRR